MPVEISIPSGLCRFTDGARVVEAEAATVGDALRGLIARHPELGPCIFGDDGEPLWFVRVFKDGVSTLELDGLDTPVKDRDRLTLLVAMAGG